MENGNKNLDQQLFPENQPEEKLPAKECLKCKKEFIPEGKNFWTCKRCRKANTKFSGSAIDTNWR